MATSDHNQHEPGTGAAVASAAAAAITGATVAYAVRKYQHGEDSTARADVDEDQLAEEDEQGRTEEERTTVGRSGSGVWHAAFDALLPLADDAAEAAGRWAAKNAPPLIRDQLIPSFIAAFNKIE